MNFKELEEIIQSGITTINLNGVEITPEILALIFSTNGAVNFTFEGCFHDMEKRPSVGLAGAGSSVTATKSDKDDIDEKLKLLIKSCEVLAGANAIKFNDTSLPLNDELISSILKYIRGREISFIFHEKCKLQSVSTNLIKLFLEHDYLVMTKKGSPIIHSLDSSNLSKGQIQEIIGDIRVSQYFGYQGFNNYKIFLPEGLLKIFNTPDLRFLTQKSLKPFAEARKEVMISEMQSLLDSNSPIDIFEKDPFEKELFLDQIYQTLGFFPIQEAIRDFKLSNQFPKGMDEREKSIKVRALLFLIEYDSRLKAIDLSDNHLGDEAISAIADCLREKNKKISKFNFRNTRCYGNDALERIIAMLSNKAEEVVRGKFTISFSSDVPSPDIDILNRLKSTERDFMNDFPFEVYDEKSIKSRFELSHILGGVTKNYLKKSFFEAIVRDDISEMKSYIANRYKININIHSRNSDGLNALMLAAKSGSFNALQWCILNGVGRSIDSSHFLTKKTALMEACAHKDPRCAALLIQHGASLTQMDIKRKTANDYAKYYDLAKIKDSFRSKFNNYGYASLLIQLRKPSRDIVSLPIGDYLALKFRQGSSLAELERFREHFRSVDSDGRNILMSALCSAKWITDSAEKSLEEEKKKIIEATGISLEKKEEAIRVATEESSRKKEEAIRVAQNKVKDILREFPEFLKSTDDYDVSCLHFAASPAGCSEFLKLLLESASEYNGFSRFINAPDNVGLTPLHKAIEAKKLPEIQVLIENGANLCAIDAKGLLPLDYADDEIMAFIYSLISEAPDQIFFRSEHPGIEIEAQTYPPAYAPAQTIELKNIIRSLQEGGIKEKFLYLGRNSIGDEGAVELAQALGDTGLIGLDLNSNDIGDDGALALAKALQDPRSKLISLNLCTNRIGIEGSKGLAKALKRNITLKDLGLYCNDIGPEGLMAMAEALKTNKTLIKITIGYGELSPESLEALNKINEIIKENRNYQAIADKLIEEFSLQHLLPDESMTSIVEGRLELSLAPRKAGASAGGGAASAAGGAGAAAGGGSASAVHVRLSESGVYDFSRIDSKSTLAALNNLLSRSRDNAYDIIEAIKGNGRNSSGRILLNKVKFALRDESIDPSFKTDLLKEYFLDFTPDFLLTGKEPPRLLTTLPVRPRALIAEYVGRPYSSIKRVEEVRAMAPTSSQAK
jgi:ankyrin repeat protein